MSRTCGVSLPLSTEHELPKLEGPCFPSGESEVPYNPRRALANLTLTVLQGLGGPPDSGLLVGQSLCPECTSGSNGAAFSGELPVTTPSPGA